MSWGDVGKRLDSMIGAKVDKLLIGENKEVIVFVTDKGDFGFCAVGD